MPIRSSLVGRPNVYNLLAATAAACALGLPATAIAGGLSALRGVPGRFEVVSAPNDEVTVVVDYAHTDDALRNLLETARPLTRGRIVTVFGCGGDRDRTKRPLMGMVAARLSDVVVITSDNPRSEVPEAIIDEIKRGIPAGEAAASGRVPDVMTVVDRAEAIDRAVAIARAGDVVLVAGKGHEKTQHIGAQRAALRRRRGVAGGAGPPARAPGELTMQLDHGTYTAADLVHVHVRGGNWPARPAAASARWPSTRGASRPGELFFAIVAGRDGHDFVPAAIAGGAAGVVVQRPVDVPAGADPVIVEVADTLRALQDLARAVRRASGARVVAITGSAGKTTTKDAIAAVLGARYRVVKNRGNLNNHLGLPISLVELRTAPDVAVMELGMNHAGEIRVLVDIAQPDVRVWTNVGDAHIGYFGSRDGDSRCQGRDPRTGRPGDAAGLQRRRPAGDGAGGGVPRPGR